MMKWKYIFLLGALVDGVFGIGMLFNREYLIHGLILLTAADVNLVGYVIMRNSDD